MDLPPSPQYYILIIPRYASNVKQERACYYRNRKSIKEDGQTFKGRRRTNCTATYKINTVRSRKNRPMPKSVEYDSYRSVIVWYQSYRKSNQRINHKAHCHYWQCAFFISRQYTTFRINYNKSVNCSVLQF